MIPRPEGAGTRIRVWVLAESSFGGGESCERFPLGENIDLPCKGAVSQANL